MIARRKRFETIALPCPGCRKGTTFKFLESVSDKVGLYECEECGKCRQFVNQDLIQDSVLQIGGRVE